MTAPTTPVQPQPTTAPVPTQPTSPSALPWVAAIAVPALLAAAVGGWLSYMASWVRGWWSESDHVPTSRAIPLRV